MSDIRLRPATGADRALLEDWDAAAHVRAAFGDDAAPDWRADLSDDDPAIERLIAEEDGRPVGYLEICDPARERTHYWGDVEKGLRAVDIWIGAEKDLDRGLGTRMMRLALERCFADVDVDATIIDPIAANERAIRFYRRLGFIFQEYRVFERTKCAIMRLTRRQWEQTCDAAIRHDPC